MVRCCDRKAFNQTCDSDSMAPSRFIQPIETLLFFQPLDFSCTFFSRIPSTTITLCLQTYSISPFPTSIDSSVSLFLGSSSSLLPLFFTICVSFLGLVLGFCVYYQTASSSFGSELARKNERRILGCQQLERLASHNYCICFIF